MRTIFNPPPMRRLAIGEVGYLIICHDDQGSQPFPTAPLPREVAKYLYDFMQSHVKGGAYFTCEEAESKGHGKDQEN